MTTTYATKAAPKPASDKQVAFIESLMKTRKNGKVYVGTQLAAWKVESVNELTSMAASSVIGVLLGEPEVAVEKSAKPQFVTVEPGFYCDPMDPAKIWQVKKSKSSGNTYAMELVVKPAKVGAYGNMAHGVAIPAKGEWVFRPGAMKQAKHWQALTLEKAAQFGKQTGVCCCCGRTLTNPDSIDAGIGPICAKGF